jgi:hypothetical protein
MNIPGQRKPGQIGGRGGHGKNMHNAQKRDSRPTSGKFPWLVVLFIAVGATLSLLSLIF